MPRRPRETRDDPSPWSDPPGRHPRPRPENYTPKRPEGAPKHRPIRYCSIASMNGGIMLKNVSRRDFLRASAAVAAPMIVPATVFGTQDKAAPSNRLGVGHIGVGTMGYNHVKGNLGY